MMKAGCFPNKIPKEISNFVKAKEKKADFFFIYPTLIDGKNENIGIQHMG